MRLGEGDKPPRRGQRRRENCRLRNQERGGAFARRANELSGRGVDGASCDAGDRVSGTVLADANQQTVRWNFIGARGSNDQIVARDALASEASRVRHQ